MVKQASSKGIKLRLYLAAVAYAIIGLLLWKVFNTIVPLILLFAFSLFTIMLGIYVGGKIPEKTLYPIYIGGNSKYWYFISLEGLYQNKQLLVSWGEIADIRVLDRRLYVPQNDQRPIKGVTIRMISDNIFAIGDVEITTKDGRSFVLKDVLNPDDTVDFIKRNYMGVL